MRPDQVPRPPQSVGKRPAAGNTLPASPLLRSPPQRAQVMGLRRQEQEQRGAWGLPGLRPPGPASSAAGTLASVGDSAPGTQGAELMASRGLRWATLQAGRAGPGGAPDEGPVQPGAAGRALPTELDGAVHARRAGNHWVHAAPWEPDWITGRAEGHRGGGTHREPQGSATPGQLGAAGPLPSPAASAGVEPAGRLDGPRAPAQRWGSAGWARQAGVPGLVSGGGPGLAGVLVSGGGPEHSHPSPHAHIGSAGSALSPSAA